jgi:glycosyltransferase involved in cell wall biosynthesis
MRVVLLSSSVYPPRRGGTEHKIYETSKWLRQRGNEVVVITSKPQGALPKELINNVLYLRIQSLKIVDRILIPIFPSKYVIKNLLYSDIICAEELMNTFTLIFLAFASFFDKKTVLEVHNECPRDYKRFILFSVLETLFKFSLKKASLIFGETKLDLAYYTERNIFRTTKKVLIPPGVTRQIFEEKTRNAKLDHLGISPSRQIMLLLGRIDPDKGQDVAIDAFYALIKKMPDLPVVLCISGKSNSDYINTLKNRAIELKIANAVIFIPNPSEDLKISLLDSATIVLIPSLYYSETFCITLSEAWARKKAVIASRVGGLAIRIEHNKTGILVQPGNPVELSDAIIQLLENPCLRSIISLSPKPDVRTTEDADEQLASEFSKILS